MKLVLAIVQDKNTDALAREFIQNNVRTAKSVTSDGFLEAGSTTFIVGIGDDRANEILEIIKKNSHTREQYVSNVNMDVAGTSMLSKPIRVIVGEATVFVLPVEEFRHF